MEGYPFYIINLDRSKDRWNNMKTHYDNNNIVRVEGYDGNIIDSYNDIRYAKYNHRDVDFQEGLYKFELGCSFSHVKAIKQAYEDGLEEVFIVEDDILNTYKNKWRHSLKEIISNKPKDTECLIFFSTNIHQNILHIRCPYCFWKWSPVFNDKKKDAITGAGHNSTGIYYINRRGMKKIYDRYIKNNIIDFTNIQEILIADKLLIYPQLNTYHITKPTFIDECKDSFVHDLHVRYNMNNNLLLKQYFHNQPNYNIYK